MVIGHRDKNRGPLSKEKILLRDFVRGLLEKFWESESGEKINSGKRNIKDFRLFFLNREEKKL